MGDSGGHHDCVQKSMAVVRRPPRARKEGLPTARGWMERPRARRLPARGAFHLQRRGWPRARATRHRRRQDRRGREQRGPTSLACNRPQREAGPDRGRPANRQQRIAVQPAPRCQRRNGGENHQRGADHRTCPGDVLRTQRPGEHQGADCLHRLDGDGRPIEDGNQKVAGRECPAAPASAPEVPHFRFPGRLVTVVLNALMGLPPVVVGLVDLPDAVRLRAARPFGLLFTPTAMVVAQPVLVRRSSQR